MMVEGADILELNPEYCLSLALHVIYDSYLMTLSLGKGKEIKVHKQADGKK